MASDLFKLINDLSYKKDGSGRGVKVPVFILNKAFSFGGDTILYANQVNKMEDVTLEQAYEYYYHALPPAKRYNKWIKQKNIEYFDAVQRYFNLSYQKTMDALSILSKDQLIYIQNQLDEGGFSA